MTKKLTTTKKYFSLMKNICLYSEENLKIKLIFFCYLKIASYLSWSHCSLLKFTKKPDKWKKHSVWLLCLPMALKKCVQGWFENFQVTSVEKRELRGTFLSLVLCPQLQKTFPQFPFFYLVNLEESQIKQG